MQTIDYFCNEYNVMRSWFAWYNAQPHLNPVWGPSSPVDRASRHALSDHMQSAAFNPDNVAGYHPGQSAAERARRGC